MEKCGSFNYFGFIFLNNTDVEKYGSFISFGYIYIYIYIWIIIIIIIMDSFVIANQKRKILIIIHFPRRERKKKIFMGY